MTPSSSTGVGSRVTQLERFLALVPLPLRDELRAAPEVEAWLDDQLGQARRAWPELQLDEQVFLRYLAEHFPADTRLDRLLANWQLDDLYLCCACVIGHERAALAFERAFGSVLERAVRRQRVGETLVEEVVQLLREQLLVSSDSGFPMLTRYTGPGRLRSWLWVVATRTARRVLEAEQKLRPLTDEQLERALLDAPGPDVEGLLLRQTHRGAFTQAFKRALSSLPLREVALLRYRYREQLGVQEIGAIYRVHFSTASRWLDRAKRAVLERTHAELATTLQLESADCWSLIRSLASDVDATFTSLLGD